MSTFDYVVARRGLTIRALRLYESQALLSPERPQRESGSVRRQT